MSDHSLHERDERKVTYISNTFIDEYMKDANGEYVKIYLYLLRCLAGHGKDFSITKIADALEHTTKDISRALRYWERANLLRLEYNTAGELVGICLLDPDQPRLKICRDRVAAPKPPEIPFDMVLTAPMIGQQEDHAGAYPLPEASNIVPMQPRTSFAEGPEHNYTPDEITLLGKDDEVQEILFVTESYMGHPLSPTETNAVLYWYDGMHMSSDLIEYLVEYCIERGHKNIRYMNRVAINWNEEGVTSKEEAIRRTKSHSRLYGIVRKAFGIVGRDLSASEEKFIDTWQKEYGFSAEMIEEACNRTILKAHNPSFAYADSILKSWYKAGAKSLSDIKAIDEAYSQNAKQAARKPKAAARTDRFHNFEEQQYDFDAIERRLLMQE